MSTMTEATLDALGRLAAGNNRIAPEHFERLNVKRGLRNSNGTGVLVGLTEVGEVTGYELVDGKKMPCEGRLYYRGIDLRDLVAGFQSDGRRGFEETAYLLLFGKLPTRSELEGFCSLLDESRDLPAGFTENMILKIPSREIMNKLQRSVLVLYSHDPNPDDISVRNLVRQSIQFIARFPTIISYGFQAKAHYFDDKSLFIHKPQPGIGTAENVLHMIRADNGYSKTEAETLDLCLVLHAEHGGGNNSTFTTHVVSSTGTDSYSAIAAAIGSLKGPKHGGANIRVRDMIVDIRANVPEPGNRQALKEYLRKIMLKQAFDGAGLIYGMGHAVYTRSDPRALLLKAKARELALEKNAEELFLLYSSIEELTKELFAELKGDRLTISANVDLYSGFVYELLNIPFDIYTPLFAVARIAGWCAHRIEQIVSDPRIMRPAYASIGASRPYLPMAQREVLPDEGEAA